MNATITPTTQASQGQDQADAQFLDVLAEAHRGHRLFFGEEISFAGHGSEPTELGRRKIAGNGESRRRRGSRRPVPRPEPLHAAPLVGLTGTAEGAGAFLYLSLP